MPLAWSPTSGVSCGCARTTGWSRRCSRRSTCCSCGCVPESERLATQRMLTCVKLRCRATWALHTVGIQPPARPRPPRRSRCTQITRECGIAGWVENGNWRSRCSLTRCRCWCYCCCMLLLRRRFGICIAHNGNLTNTTELQAELEAKRRHINTTSVRLALLGRLALDAHDPPAHRITMYAGCRRCMRAGL